LAQFPEFVENFVDKSLESKMQKAQTISSLVLSLRKKEMIKVRQPLQKVMIPVLDENQRAEIEAVSDLIKAEVNVKEIVLLDDASGILVKQIKPNFKTLGPRFGKEMGLISKEIQGFTPDQINELEREGTLAIVIGGNAVSLTLEDVEITSQDIEGWLVANEGSLTVALDVTITETLQQEGIAREIINKIQNLRKDKDFQVLDRIKVRLEKNENISPALANFKSYIANEVLAINISEDSDFTEFDEVDINGTIIKTHIAVANN
jgi:isoleucyl-tRNA synthetase